MKTIAYAFVFLLAAFLAMLVLGNVGITYPNVVEKEPLKDPIKVQSISGNIIETSDGRVLDLGIQPEGGHSWNDIFMQSGYMVEIKSARDGMVAIYANQKGWICGTPWARTMTIPLIPETVYRDRRELVAVCDESDQRTTSRHQKDH
jgi:hypothetical protein